MVRKTKKAKFKVERPAFARLRTELRTDIAEAYYCMEIDWHSGGWLRERPTNQRKRRATSVQLTHLNWRADNGLWTGTLTAVGKTIYNGCVRRYGFRMVHLVGASCPDARPDETRDLAACDMTCAFCWAEASRREKLPVLEQLALGLQDDCVSTPIEESP